MVFKYPREVLGLGKIGQGRWIGQGRSASLTAE